MKNNYVNYKSKSRRGKQMTSSYQLLHLHLPSLIQLLTTSWHLESDHYIHALNRTIEINCLSCCMIMFPMMKGDSRKMKDKMIARTEISIFFAALSLCPKACKKTAISCNATIYALTSLVNQRMKIRKPQKREMPMQKEIILIQPFLQTF